MLRALYQIYAAFMQSATFRRLYDQDRSQGVAGAILRAANFLLPFLDQPRRPDPTTTPHLTLPFSVTIPIAPPASASSSSAVQQMATIYFGRDGSVKLQRGEAISGTFNDPAWEQAEKGVLKQIITNPHGLAVVIPFTDSRQLPEAEDDSHPAPDQTAAPSSVPLPPNDLPNQPLRPDAPVAGPSRGRPLEREYSFIFPDRDATIRTDHPPPSRRFSSPENVRDVPIAGPSRGRPLQREFSFMIPDRDARIRTDNPPPSRQFDLQENLEVVETNRLGGRVQSNIEFERFIIEFPQDTINRTARLARRMFAEGEVGGQSTQDGDAEEPVAGPSRFDGAYSNEDEEEEQPPRKKLDKGKGKAVEYHAGVKRSREEFEADHEDDEDPEIDEEDQEPPRKRVRFTIPENVVVPVVPAPTPSASSSPPRARVRIPLSDDLRLMAPSPPETIEAASLSSPTPGSSSSGNIVRPSATPAPTSHEAPVPPPGPQPRRSARLVAAAQPRSAPVPTPVDANQDGGHGRRRGARAGKAKPKNRKN